MVKFSELVAFTNEVGKEKVEVLKEVASWDNPKLKAKDRETISCDDDERYERVPIKNAVKRLYPKLFTDDEIDNAIESCCKKYSGTRERDAFYACVLNKLFEDIS
jgi:hypothetical protein